jgi:hypothetical protein
VRDDEFDDVRRLLEDEAEHPEFWLLRLYINGLTEKAWQHIASQFCEYNIITRFERTKDDESSVVLLRKIRLQSREDFQIEVKQTFRRLQDCVLERLAAEATYHYQDSGVATVWWSSLP